MLQVRQWRGWLLHAGGMITWMTDPAKALAALPFLQRLAETKQESAIGWVCEAWKKAFEMEIPFHSSFLRLLCAQSEEELYTEDMVDRLRMLNLLRDPGFQFGDKTKDSDCYPHG